jgi:hypothetical protein
MRIRNFLRDLVLSGASGYFLDTPEAPAAGGVTPPASGSVTPPAGSPPPAATPPVAAAAPPATPTGFSYAEDRSRWIPPHRLTEESTKRQTLESELSTTRAQLQALTGVTPKDPATLKAEEVKTAFTQLFPHLTPLLSMSKEQIEALSKTPDVASRAISQEQRQWQRHGKQQLATIYTDVADAMNIEKLDADQQQDLKDTFTSWLKGKTTSELRASNGEESATLNRYEEGDPELLKEFVTSYVKRWVEPARRTATSQAVIRTRPTPNSQGRTQVTSVKRPDKFNSLDERLDYAANLAKERGVQFAS